MPKILAFAGSARKDSYNKKILAVAVTGARAAGAEVTVIDLADYPMPLYDGDLEEAKGLPENAKKIKALMKAHDGFLIASPEYNSSFSPLLKNTIDWCSRSEPGDKPLECYRGKTAGLIAASPGALGGLRGLFMLRQLLSNIGMLLLADVTATPQVMNAFGPEGITDEAQKAKLEGVGRSLASFTQKVIS